MEMMLWADALEKRYGSLVAVAKVGFTVRQGECFGLLGPNGAGKSSILRMIACISPITGGNLQVAGLDVRQYGNRIKFLIGVVPQEDNLDTDLTVLQNLLNYSRYFDLPVTLARQRALEGLRLFQLEDRINSRIDTLSGGMKRRLLITRALLHNPSILVLDEPTTGLDPQARRLVWEKLNYLRSQGTTLILSTHYLEEAEYLCDRLVIMNQGSIIAEGTPSGLINRYVGGQILEVRPSQNSWAEVFARLTDLGVQLEEDGEAIYVYRQDFSLVERVLSPTNCAINARPANLEDVFLHLTGRRLREG
jgi:lipooligosaccharide transport system ATP-binding protein